MEQKCSTCGILLNEDTGYWRKSRNKWQSNCKNCHNQYCSKRWIVRKKKAIEYKGGKCERCGYDKFYGALEFHHINPSEKDAEWNKIRLWGWDKMKKELDKCVCLCANCHREIHSELLLDTLN